MTGHSTTGAVPGIASIAAFLLSAASSAITTYLAVALPTAQFSTYGISLAATVIDLVGLGFLTFFILLRHSVAFSRRLWLRTAILTATAILEILGFSLTLAMLGYTINQHKHKPRVTFAIGLEGAVIGNFALASLAAVAQASFLATELASRRPSSDHETLHSRMQSSLQQPSIIPQKDTEKSLRTVALQSFAPSYARGQTTVSTAGSPHSSVAGSSLSHSFQQVIRPVTSKTGLLKQSSVRDSKSVYSIPYSVATSPSDGFDMWDTSTVDQQDRETVLQSQVTGLETIPGSRPASPFVSHGSSPQEGSEESHQSEEIVEASLPPSPTVEYRQQRALATPTPSIRSYTIRESRSSTPDESHIHPLFRSDSPAPPSTTPGTIITASPQAGQTISSDQIRARSSSRPKTPLAHSQSFEQRKSSAPPIPGFVLAEGAFAGSEPRGRASTVSTARSRAYSTRSDRTVGRAESLFSVRTEGGALMEE